MLLVISNDWNIRNLVIYQLWVIIALLLMDFEGYDMSTYIRKYAKYINEKAVAYRVMAFDFCKVKRGKEDGLLRTMAPEKVVI